MESVTSATDSNFWLSIQCFKSGSNRKRFTSWKLSHNNRDCHLQSESSMGLNTQRFFEIEIKIFPDKICDEITQPSDLPFTEFFQSLSFLNYVTKQKILSLSRGLFSTGSTKSWRFPGHLCSILELLENNLGVSGATLPMWTLQILMRQLTAYIMDLPDIGRHMFSWTDCLKTLLLGMVRVQILLEPKNAC